MAKAVIHVGMDKTGSTYIQDVCSQRRPELAALGICYPVPRGLVTINHIAFAGAHGFAPREPTTDADSLAAWKTMAHALPDPRQTLFLSSENFSHNASETTVGRLKTWLAVHGYDDVRIVVFLRNQVSWLISAYGQDIKGGRARTVEQFYQARMRLLVYSNLLGAWAAAFGQDNVTVVNYDAAQRADRQHGIMDALWSAIGIDPDSSAGLTPRQPVRGNARSPQVLLEAMRRCALPPTLLQQGHNFAAAMLGRWRAATPRPIDHARIWPLPPAFLADLPLMQRDNDAIAHAFAIPKLPDLQQSARAYQARVIPAPEAEIARCAALVRLGAKVLTDRNARAAAAVPTG